ncbi:MAG: FKBP-type peptidyl-prolyl cis-trans isomerase [Bacterioplanes sp.]|nr:FKBP-type peptidyl-prolyl cis-trans isomerase [Bacterioplanes sp.]
MIWNGIFLLLLVALLVYALRRAGVGAPGADDNIAAGEAFLQENAEAEGVVQCDSGLQWLLLEAGDGPLSPSATDRVLVHYHGTLLDGTVFDSSVARGEPIAFPLNQVIAGWTEGLQTMVVGEKKRFFIPSHLGYGRRAVAGIPGGSLLIFDVELLEITSV